MARNNLYLIAGHGEDDYGFLPAALAASGKQAPSVAYIGTANGENAMFMARMAQGLKTAGASVVRLAPLLGKGRDEDKAAAILTESDVIFISGGEVEDGMAALSPRIRALLWQLYDGGKVFIGISAGTIMMGQAWPHWDDEDNDFDNARLFDCLGFVQTIFDTHCEDEGWPELKKAVSLQEEGYVGYGIRAGGMVRVSPDGALHPNIPMDGYVCRGGEAVPCGC